MSKNDLENYNMHSGTAEMQDFLKKAVPPLPGELKKTWLYRVGYRTGLGVSRAKDLYYDKRCSVGLPDLAAIQRAYSAHVSKLDHELKTIRQFQGEMAHEAIGEIAGLLATALEKLRVAVPDRA